MKQQLATFYQNNAAGRALLSPAKWLYDIYRYRVVPEKRYLKKEFKRRQGYELNLDNPRTLNEKIQWLKLHDRTPLHTKCADKLAVRDHIKETIGERYLIPLSLVTQDPDDLAPDNLPDFPCVIKTSHNSGGVVFVLDKSAVDWPETRRHFAALLKVNPYYKTKEWQYKNIKPRILVEKFLGDERAGIPHDYKFHCFNGRLVLAQVDIDRHGDHRRNLYDRDWNLQGYYWHKKNGIAIERPKRLDELIELSEVLARDFRYLRADFYSLDNDIYFGEMTFHPAAGYERLYPQSRDLELGGLLRLDI